MDNFPMGPGGIFAQIQQQLAAGGMGVGMPGNPRQYDEYLKAYSVAMLPGKERKNVSYGGKIMMPVSALASLTQLEIESPWIFELRNPTNPAASTHAGVLEFIAEEGVVHLPYWMMKTLRLNEGDPIRLTGIALPKGKFVKIQPQTVDFLEISDPKAVLEQALRNFSTLTQGDIIEISYNSITFEILIMETQPADSPGITIVDTDLEVDFAPPKGYVEPVRPNPKEKEKESTMASKLKIDLNANTPGSSRPGSSLGVFQDGAGGGAVSKDGMEWEAFKGRGETLTGRKTKGKGISVRKIEDMQEDSKIFRSGKTKIVSNDTLQVDTKVPAPLNLPFGRLFFGFRLVPYNPPPAPEPESPGSPRAETQSFGGAGQSLSNPVSAPRNLKGKEKEVNGTGKKPDEADSKPAPVHEWGSGGNTLGTRTASGGGSRLGQRKPPQAPPKKKVPERKRSPTPDYGIDDDDDVIYVDSD